MADEKKATSNAAAIATAVAVFGPFLRAIILQAEATGATGAEKHAAVAAAAKALWNHLAESGAVKELRGIPWELVAPILVGTDSSGGLITIIVNLFNSLLGKIWTAFGVGK